MAAAKLVGKAVVGAPGEVHSSALNVVGTECDGYGKDGAPARYVYLKGVASTVEGAWVAYDEAGVTAGVDTDVAATLISPVAVATAAVVAEKYGWYAIEGHHIVNAISGGDAADGGRVFATSTVFDADDVEADDMQIHGAVFRTQEGEANSSLSLTATAGKATAQLSRPWIGHAVDASA